MLKIQAPNGENRVLLHSCCAPCSSAIIECMLANGIRPTVFYCNPNIYPQEEYEIRKQEAIRFVTSQNLDFIDADYDYTRWRNAVQGLENEPERGSRCLQCFTLRLTETARYAAGHGFSVFTTTLASSRWKSLDQINEAGRRAAAFIPERCSGSRTGGKAGCKTAATSSSRSTASTTNCIADASSAGSGWNAPKKISGRKASLAAGYPKNKRQSCLEEFVRQLSFFR